MTGNQVPGIADAKKIQISGAMSSWIVLLAMHLASGQFVLKEAETAQLGHPTVTVKRAKRI